MATEPFRLVIDGDEYPCTEFGWVQDGEKLERVWPDGFWDGIGESRVRSARKCLYANFLDLTSPPYVRLVPTSVTLGGLAAIDVVNRPLFFLQGQQPNGTNVIYFFVGDTRIKINRDSGAVIETVTTATVVYGRPALFEGTWRIARGETVDAASLTIGNGAGTDSFTAIAGSIKARHFSIVQDQGTSKLARAFSTNLIDLSSDAVTFGGDFECGDTSFGISDLLESQGELLVIKPDGPRRFAPSGDSLPLQRFITVNLQSSTIDGSNSHGHGPYAYWVTASGIWRIFGDAMLPMGFESDSQYFDYIVPSITGGGIDKASWRSVTAYGRWLYATHGRQVFQGFIEEDGLVKWYGPIYQADNAADPPYTARCIVDNGPALWVVITSASAATSDIVRFNLEADGSIRDTIDDDRGPSGTNIIPALRLGTDDFGRPDRLKQIRRFWIVTEGLAGDTLQLQASLDGAVEQQVGLNITTNGLVERVPSTAAFGNTILGSNDIFREARFGVNISVFSTTSDPRWRAFGVEVRTADIYRAKIILTPESVRGYALGIQGLLQELRALKNAQRVAIKQPELDATRNGYILSVREKVIGAEGAAGIGYEVDVLLEFFDIPASVA